MALTRRELLLALPGMAIAGRALGQTPYAPLSVGGLHQVTLAVSDVARSLYFYQNLFGAPIQARRGTTFVLRIGDGPQFLAISRAGAAEPHMNHFGMSIAGFDPERVELNAVTTYRFADDDWRLVERTYATQAVFDDGWQGREVWRREFGDDRGPIPFTRSEHSDMPWIEPPEYFATRRPEAERMSYQQLNQYIGDLEASGWDVVALRVALQRKLSFPFVALILTLIAIPFAVTTGRHGAMYGIGIGIILAFGYWLVASIFAAIGSAGLLTPLLAAWAPNVLFGGSAVYLLLAVRT